MLIFLPELKKKGRPVNLVPGYLDSFKVVLASTKNASQRTYLDGAVYLEQLRQAG